MDSLDVVNDIELLEISESFICSPEQSDLYLRKNTTSLNIIQLNIRSISRNFDQFQTLLHRIQKPMDIIVLTECRLSQCPIVPTLSGYSFHMSDYSLQNDGVVIYVSENIKCSVEIPKLADSNCLIMKHKEQFALVAIYRSPSFRHTDNFTNSLNDILISLRKFQNIAIVGDININIGPNSNASNNDRYLNTLMFHGLMPAHTLPTRNNNCLDHVILKVKSKATTLVLNTSITDHVPVILSCNINIKSKPTKQNFKRLDIKSCLSELSVTNFSPILSTQNANEAASSLVNTISDIVEKHTRTLVVPSRKKIIKPWITPGLLRCIKNRDKLYYKLKKDPENHIISVTYNRYKNFCNNLLKKVKKEYERGEFQRVIKNPKATWNLIKKHVNMDSEQTTSNDLLGTHADPIVVANDINKYFANVGKNLASKVDSKSFTAHSELDVTVPSLTSMSVLATDCAEIDNIIIGLKNTSATGWDNIPISIVKQSRPILVPILVHVFNLCLLEGIFPDVFKIGLVLPIYKGGDRSSVHNYRPISILTTFSKILEKIINVRLVNYLNSTNVLSNNQFGFRAGKSTEDAVLTLTDSITINLNKNLKSAAIFLDLSKAFDTVPISTLLRKLECIGVRGVAQNLFRTYFENRFQCIRMGGVISEREPLLFGVPQGSVLGPTLFLIYVNDLCKLSIKNCKIIMYADDTVLVVNGVNWNDAQTHAEVALGVVTHWLSQNLLTLNVDKTKCLTFSPNSVSLPPSSFTIVAHVPSCERKPICNCLQIDCESRIKYLGVWIDNHLSWKEHIKVTTGRIRKLMYLFKKLRTILDFPILKIIFMALVQSVAGYCIAAWGCAGKVKLLTLERAHRGVLKVMSFKPIWFSTSELYHELKILTVRKLFLLTVVLRKHANLAFIPNPKKRRSDIVCTTQLCKTQLAKRHFNFFAPSLYNSVNKTLNIYPTTRLECKSRVTEWLLGLTYKNTEDLIASII